MNRTSKIDENQLHQIWKNQDFLEKLITLSGDDIDVINTGVYNKDSGGPDFKHARIKIGNLTFVGDVEIDGNYSDWKKHGHNINRNYNKVILHICYSNRQKQNYVYTSDGRKVSSISIDGKIAADNLRFSVILAGKRSKENIYNLKCSSEIEIVDKTDREKFILHLGITRFQNKCKKVYRRLKELKFINELELKEPVVRYELTQEFNEKEFTHNDFRDKLIWKQVLYELVFEALGYSKNKSIMLKLAQNVNIKFLNKIEYSNYFTTQLESLYYNISGLMPELLDEEQSEYVKQLSEYWGSLSSVYDGKRFDETQWQFLGQRPQNFPTIRIAGGVKIVEAILHKNLAGVIIQKFSEINNTKVLINSIRSLLIIKAKGYWKDHFVFDKESKIKLNYIIGLSRADEIFINVILPYLSVYFDMFGNELLSKKVLRVYNEYDQKLNNKITRDVSAELQLVGLNIRTIYAQGMIELYRNYCSKNRCLECEIGKHIFI